MEAQLERDELSASAEIHFRFALGKAYEDLGDHDRAWHYYHSGNLKQRGRGPTTRRTSNCASPA